MSRTRDVNKFFGNTVYPNLLDFAISPWTWSFFEGRYNKNIPGDRTGFYLDIGLKILLSPILIPIFKITATLAFLGALISCVAQFLSLMVAIPLDCVDPKSPDITVVTVMS